MIKTPRKSLVSDCLGRNPVIANVARPQKFFQNEVPVSHDRLAVGDTGESKNRAFAMRKRRLDRA